MRAFLTLLVAPLVFVLGLSGPASAASLGEIDFGVRQLAPSATTFSTSWGTAGFKKYGDVLIVNDLAADGKWVGLQWKTGSRAGICIGSQGKDLTYSYVCNKDFPEYQYVTMRMGRCDSRVYTCRDSVGWVDWTSWQSLYNSN